MSIDPYYEQMTAKGKIRKWLVSVWPHVYNAINHIFDTLMSSLFHR